MVIINNDELKIIVQAIVDKQKSESTINAQIAQIKTKALEMELKISDKEAKKHLTEFNQMQAALSKTEQNRIKERESLEKKQAAAINKNLEDEYKQRLKLEEQQKRQIELSIKQAEAAHKSNINLDLDKLKLTSKIEAWATSNTNALKVFGSELEGIKSQIESADDFKLSNLNKEFNILTNNVKAAGLEGQSFWNSLKSNIAKFSSWFGIGAMVAGAVREVRQMINSVTELDSSLVELSKVQDFTGDGLQKFTDRAFAAADGIGRTGKEVIDATATFKRAGYELESSLNMAQAALIMTNVGDGIRDVTEASSSLIAVLRGFNISDSNVMSVVDMINEVSNNAPVDFANITDGLQRVSGTLAQTGSSIEETIGLLTGGFAQLRNMEKVSTALITISQRLRGVGEDGEVIDGLAAKLQDDFKDLAGIDIELNGELRSTFDILKDYAAVYDTLTVKEQQRLSELAAGIRQVPVINAIVQQWDDVEKAIESASNSLGSAEAENEKFLNSIEGKINKYNTALQKLSATTIDSDFLKGAVDTGTSFLNLLTTIIDKVGILTPLLAALTAGLTLKSNTGEISSKLPLHVKVA